MTDTQLDFSVEARAQILDRVLANGSDEWREKGMRAIARVAATGKIFQAVDLLNFGAVEPDSPNRWGSLLLAASRAGLIEHVGYEASHRATVQGSATKTWRGADVGPTADRVVELRALSIHRPYAALILASIKPVENRSWNTRYRGLLVIHAAKSKDTLFPHEQALLKTPYQVTVGMLPDLEPTGFVGVAELYDICSRTATDHFDNCACGPWAIPGQHHWRLRNPVPFRATVTANGRQGLFKPPLLIEDIARRMAAHPEAIS